LSYKDAARAFCRAGLHENDDSPVAVTRQSSLPMPVRLYVHLTWTTLRRLPVLNPEVARFLERFLRQEAARHGSRVLELGIAGAPFPASFILCPFRSRAISRRSLLLNVERTNR